MALFPLFGIMRSEEVAQAYLPDTSFLFLGGLMVAVAVEKSNLHQRIALLVLKLCGSQPQFIMLGFMSVTGFLSMWISNTATTALMVPIVQGVIMELVTNHRMQEMFLLSERSSMETRRRSVECTATNLVLVGQLEKLFPGANTGINFLSWIIFALPLAVSCLFMCWLILWMLFMRHSPKGNAIVTRKLHDKYEQLPPISFAEVSVSVCFLTMLGLWVFREPDFVAGYGSMFKDGYLSDSTVAIIIVIVLFMLPDGVPKCFSVETSVGLITQAPKRIVRGSLLDWQTIQERFPWSILLLLGGGFALAAGVKESKLSLLIGSIMQQLEVFPMFVIMLIILTITLVLTNICSNTVVASIFLPIVSELARSLHINPLYFMLPVAVGSSFAFLLPVATPPNAIVFSHGVVKVKDMAISGFLLTISCLGLTMLNMGIWGRFVLHLDHFPLWAYDADHPMRNVTMMKELLARNETIIPAIPLV
ncbi:unnamed protein product, partial [Mesorhabditis spiculigera]